MKRSRFYCENCAAEVKPNARVCPACGRFFSAVRCPQCQYTGEANAFVYGCPNCGYAASAGPAGKNQDTADWEVLGDADSLGSLEAGRPYHGAEIPGWVWYLAAGILTLVFGVLVIVYLNL